MLKNRLFLTRLTDSRLRGVNRPKKKTGTPFNCTESTFFNSVSGLTDLLTDHSVSGLSAYIKALTNPLNSEGVK
jgi:hypothetical protein